MGSPDPFLRARPVADQGFADELRDGQYASDTRRRARRLHRGELEAGSVVMSENKSPAPPAAPVDENQIIAERRGKLTALRARGHADPNEFAREPLAAALEQGSDALAN